MLLNNKSVVITGAGQGIGAACAKGAALQGASVVVNDVDAARANATVDDIRAHGGKAIACVANITDWEEAGRLIRTCIDTYGKIDGLVNNASLFHRSRLDEFDPAVARALVDVNILGTLHCAAHAVKPMLAQGSGSIVNVTSDVHMGIPPYGIYGATKGAVASLVYTWALELAGTGIRVNALSPSGATRMVVMSAEEEEEGNKRYAAAPPAENNSPVVEFLLSDRSVEVTGQLVRTQGDYLFLYTHPALLVPPAIRSHWTADAVIEVFDNEFKGRLVACGTFGMETLPVDVARGYKAN